MDEEIDKPTLRPGNAGPGTNTGHGHVWKRPDGNTARCGGPEFCDECYDDALMWGDGSPEPQGIITAGYPATKVPPQFVRGNRRDRRAARARDRK